MRVDARDALSVSLIVAVVVGIFAQNFSHQLIGYDDPYFIGTVPQVTTGLSWENFKWAWSTTRMAIWHPFTWHSYQLESALFGAGNDGARFLVNAWLHLSNAVLVFLLCKQLSFNRIHALIIALLFATHPQHVEVIAWVSERKELLASGFVLLSLRQYLIHQQTQKMSAYYFSLLFFIFALLSKASAAPLAVLLPVLDLLRMPEGAGQNLRRRHWRYLVAKWLPFLIAAVGISIVTMNIQASGVAEKLGSLDSGLSYLAMMGVRFAWYLKMSFWPTPIYLFHTSPEILSAGMMASSAFIIAIFLALVWWFRSNTLFLIGIAWFILFLAPTSGIVPVDAIFVSNRYSYQAHIGLFIALLAIVKNSTSRAATLAIPAFLCVGIIIFSIISWKQTAVWKDSISLFKNEIRFNPSDENLYIQLGFAYGELEDNKEAKAYFNQAIELKPNGFYGYAYQGFLAEKLDKLSEAQKFYQQALKATWPYKYHHVQDVYEHISWISGIQKNHVQALFYLKLGLEYFPDSAYLQELKHYYETYYPVLTKKIIKGTVPFNGNGRLRAMKFLDLLRFITPHRSVLYLILGLLLLNSVISLANPWIAGQFTVRLLDSGEAYFSNIKFILIAWLALIAIKSLLSFASAYLLGSTGENISANLRSRIYDHIQALPLSYHQEQRSGDTLALLSNDAVMISNFVTHTLVQLLPLFVTLVGAFVMMMLIEPGIALLAAGLLPVYFVSMKLIGRRIRPLTRQWIDAYSDMFSLVKENLGLLPAIKAFTREPMETERFNSKNTTLLRITKQQLFVQSLLTPAISFLAGVGLLLLLWLASQKLQTGVLDAADLVSLLLYAMLLTRPVSGLANVYGQVQQARGAAERILALFSVQAEPLGEGSVLQADVRGRIRFIDVSYAYPGRREVLNGLNLEIQAGETVALTGENGAGKSTLVHLLMRMIEADKGRILIDDIDIRGVSLASLRGQIGLVAQHTLLLNSSVADNIAYGRPLTDRKEIEQAARTAHAHEFISELPQGYDTIIGDQGLRLSGGQRQRISLARTLLKNPPILIFDEATSMFDPAGEKEFIAECRHLLKQRTVILITHRPASLALADRVIKLNTI